MAIIGVVVAIVAAIAAIVCAIFAGVQAAAEERANMLREQAIERPHPKFTVERVRNSQWRAANVGNALLYSAVVEGVAGSKI